MNAVWHEPYLPGDRTVDVHVRRVRVKLGAHASRLSTLRGYGYRFD
jgi:DNA-binding response OmpR family regulator